ncbi:trifunctional serine/threonine-protein kinase/ATP-binding protein/sensor histidine kinase [Cronobacter dublinensis]|uniref:trifunctional serine/threonine-protein kinase/ATP-binding protein/sensor histidine kinase n=1 Tax=Cronobacter dublinensis TaxID=413497 RepID=UPI0024AD75AF|nr:ATP-binding sensor histidine kinase [Cronobacter dublinensis]MDI6439459.1 AAA family ATPase [Cronobacter dublinensis]
MSEASPPAFWPLQGSLSENRAFVLKEDVIFTLLAQEGAISWLKGRHHHSGGAFFIATAVNDEEEANATRRLRNEFALRDALSSAWAVKPAASTQFRGRFALVYAPFSFKLLTGITGKAMASLSGFLELALRICAPLQQMHLHNLIHGDIKPGNIFLCDDASCRLAGFGLSTLISDEHREARLPAAGGTPAYMSPEHTAHTRRAVDSRSDLYSLGVVLYELLTGCLPFTLNGNSPAEWAHHHVASEPRPPHEARPGLPPVLSEILLRLLAKTPEGRYQTVDGLIADLRRCQATLAGDETIAPFTPGLQDRAFAFHLADALGTTHPQVREVLNDFDEVSRSGLSRLVIISGPSGIGKSSLLASALKALHPRNALLAVGKVDQFAPALPWAVLTAAFRSLTLHLLGLPSDEVAQWRSRLSRALDGYEELAVSLVPELRSLLEIRAGFSPDTFAIDARARFNHMVLALVKTFATHNRPLVLLLDDLQWADAASLHILEYLLQNCAAVPLLMVVACRHDPTQDEPLAGLTLAAPHTTMLRPTPLSVKAVARWLSNLLQTTPACAADLAALIHEKTGGNPLFVQEFFRRIVDDGLVTYHTHQTRWSWSLQAIRTRHYTENVVTLVLQQLEELPPETQKLLGSLACLGCSGDLVMVSGVVGLSPAEILYQLHPAVVAQLITITQDDYAFTHDRVQEAAFALLTPDEKRRIHLTTASVLAQAARHAAGNDLLFRAVHHVTAALESIEPAPQRQMFRELSLLAARRARFTGDYRSALTYLHTARALGHDASTPDFTLTTAVTHGDMTVACFAACHQIINFLSRGDHLDGVLTSIERGLAFVRKTRFQDVESILLIQRHYVEHLRTPADTLWRADEVFPDDLLPPVSPQAPERLSTLGFWFGLYRAMAHFACGDYAQAAQRLEQAGTLAWSAPGHIHLLDFHFYSALSLSLQLTPETFSAEYRRRIHQHYDKIALWARVNPGTFADKEALVYAEIVRLDGMNSIALEQYERAITLSRDAGFTPYHALAHELAGRFARSCGYTTTADAHYRGAIAAWGRAGAQAKVRQLEQAFPHLLTPTQASAYDTVAFAQNEEIRDLQSVIKASRALSEEINLERLIEILMTIVLERAGAQRGLLIRVSENHAPEMEASATTCADGVRVRILRDVPLADDLPLSVLSAVIRTGQEIRTGNPETFHPFSQDPYLVASGAAVMCVPMFKQARLVGVLYLENRLVPDVFTAGHSRVVSLLGAQAAVSLETARLYAELLEENIQRRRVEKELRASQTSLMLGEQISNTGSWRWELQQDLMFMSEEYARILGLPEKQKMISMAEFLTFVHPDDYPRISTLVTESVREGLTMRAEFRIIRADGVVRYLLGIGDPVGVGSEVNEYYGIITDITTQRLAEDAMRVAQADLARVSRATTVGQLTSSIAHEINQPLMSIVSNAGASLRWLDRDPARLEKVREGLHEIVSEGERAGEIIRSLQSLTRKQDPVFAAIDLHAQIRHIMLLSRSELEQRNIQVEYALAAADSVIYGDSVQIQQVLLNLVMNAVEAMDEVQGRARLLTLATCTPSPGVVRCEIADTGTGIDAALTGRIFESFWSTKPQGMGMGLTICHNIIDYHHGKLTVAPRAPFGSAFAFTLPLAAASDAMRQGWED